MTTRQRRTILPGGGGARQELTSLLANVWVAEAVRPGRLLVIAAPELADTPVLDNRAGGFSGLDPGWGERVLRLSELVLRVLSQGGEAWLLTRERAEGPNRLLSRVRERASEIGLDGRLRTAEVAALPVAGIFGDDYAVLGAIAFKDSGPDFTGEGVLFECKPEGIARTSIHSQLEGLLT